MDQLKKRKREQEKQKRERLVQSKADPFPSQVDSHSIAPPRFPSLKRSDGQSDELTRMTKTILGPYDACQVAMQSMNHNQQQQLLGTFEATPSTPLHQQVTGNPFDRQFGKSVGGSGLTSSTSLSTKGSSSSSGLSASSSAAQSRAELNRHSVAEPPSAGRSDDRKVRTTGHARNDHTQNTKMTKQPSDSQFSTPKLAYKKSSSKSASESANDATSSHPSNVLPVRKKEKGRIRPFKSSGASSPTTGNQPGLTHVKKSAGTSFGGASQGAGDLFKVENSGTGGPIRSTTPVASESVGPLRSSTSPAPPPSSSKRPPKLKKRHSHHSSMTTPTSNSVTIPTNEVSGQTIRKSTSVQSISSAITPHTSSSHKHRKQSSSGTHSTSHSSASPSLPPTTKKQGNPSSLTAAHSSDRKNRVKSETSSLDQRSTSTVHIPVSSSVSAMSQRPSGNDTTTSTQANNQLSSSEERLARKRKKRARRERERMQNTTEESTVVIKTETTLEQMDTELTKPLQKTTQSNLQPSNTTQQLKSYNSMLPTSCDPIAPGQVVRTSSSSSSRTKMDKMAKPRPTNLSIDAYGDSTEGSPLDIRDIQHLLKELMCNVSVPSPITPLPTPRKMNTPFTFPITSITTAMKQESLPEAPPIGPAYALSESENNSSDSSSSSESSSESSDCDEEVNEVKGQEKKGEASSISMEEGEDNTTPGWDKVLPSVGDSITPLKKTPPYSTASTPQLSTIVPAGLHTASISPMDTPIHPHPPTNLPNIPSVSFHSTASNTVAVDDSDSSKGTGMGGFVLGMNILQNQTTAKSFSGFLSGNDSLSDNSVPPIYSQASIVGSEVAPSLTSGEDTVLSMGFPVVDVSGSVMAVATTGEASDGSSSESEGEESGSESDDEMSDDGDSSSSEEEDVRREGDTTKDPHSTGRPAVPAKPSIGGSSSVSSIPLLSGEDSLSFQEEIYGGFFNDDFNDDDFMSRFQGNGNETQTKGEDNSNPMSQDSSGSHWFQSATDNTLKEASGNLDNGCGGDVGSEPQPMVIAPLQQEGLQSTSQASSSTDSLSISTLIDTPLTITDKSHNITPVSKVTASSVILSHQNSLDTEVSIRRESIGKKRKLERQASVGAEPTQPTKFQPPARKAPRTIGSATARRRDSSISSFSVSSDSSSDSADSSDEHSDDKDTSLPNPSTSPHSKSFMYPPPPLPLVSNTTTAQPSTSVTSSPSSSAIFTSHPPSLPTNTTIPPATNHSNSPPTSQQLLLPQRQQDLGTCAVGEERSTPALTGEDWTEEGGRSGGRGQLQSLWVKIPLQKIDFQKDQKPKAKVEPYNVTAPSKPPRRRSTVDSTNHEDLSRLAGSHHSVDHDDRGMYSRQRDREDDHHGQYSRTDFHREDGRRSHRSSSGWDSGRDRDNSWSTGRHSVRVNRSHDRERDHHRNRNWEEYDGYEGSKSRNRPHPSNRNMSAEECLREARKIKHDADRTRAPGIDKAKAYLESVVYFMRHGDAIEKEAQSWDGAQTRNPFRLYMDTITLMKYCRSWANDSKQLVALCMRCVSVLYWKLFLLKQTAAGNIQKDLQDFFIPSKNTQKSPYLGSLSPIPSPASVGSTGSTGSGVGGASSSLGSTQDPSPSSHVTVPKLIFNKAAEHLTITGYVQQSMELWQQSNIIVDQYREFFSSIDRRCVRITQFSPIAAVADWLEAGARQIRYHS